MYRIVIVDDHDIFRIGINAILNKDPELEIVGEASNGVELLELMKTTTCDLVILDLSMPEKDGFSLLEDLSLHYPNVKKLVLSMLVNKATLKRVLIKGVEGFVNKRGIALNLLDAIYSIRSGKKHFSKEINELIMSNYDEIFLLKGNIEGLTKRELQVMRLIAQSMTNKAISKVLK